MATPQNLLCFGDNLGFLKDTSMFPDEGVDLIYLDPPFNSQRGYNVLFKEVDGTPSVSQIRAFDDTWEWDTDAAMRYEDIVHAAPERVVAVITALEKMLGHSPMFAYLIQMAVRLVQLHRVLKKTGSLFLHCDPTASHYLKMVLDAVFGHRNFVNEIVWKRTSAHGDVAQGARHVGRIHDIILFYRKSERATFHTQYTEYADEYLDQFYRHVDEAKGKRYRLGDLTAAKPGGDVSFEWRVKRKKGGAWMGDLTEDYKNPKRGWEYKGVPPYKNRFWAYKRENMEQMEREGLIVYSRTGFPQFKRYLDEKGVPLQDIWTDIPPVVGHERLGYPTQKPTALLSRIISLASNAGDVILDPFCGCGTTIDAVEIINRKSEGRKKRRWVGIDITYLAVTLIKNRLARFTNPTAKFEIMGEPADVRSATFLAQRDRYQFQYWALGLVGARPWGGEKKKGADKGIDGVRFFLEKGEDEKIKPAAVLVQVKSGHVNSAMIRDFHGTLEREKAPMGIFITLEEPTKDMKGEAVACGQYQPSWVRQKYPRIQILTVEQLLNDPPRPNPQCLLFPTGHSIENYKQAKPIKQSKEDSDQPDWVKEVEPAYEVARDD
ncbi:MAG: DNA methyltransferase [bacterium]